MTYYRLDLTYKDTWCVKAEARAVEREAAPLYDDDGGIPSTEEATVYATYWDSEEQIKQMIETIEEVYNVKTTWQ